MAQNQGTNNQLHTLNNLIWHRPLVLTPRLSFLTCNRNFLGFLAVILQTACV